MTEYAARFPSTETSPVVEAEFSQYQRNLGFFEAMGVTGGSLAQIYIQSVRLEPRLREVELLAIEPGNPAAGSARPGWLSPNGRHEIRLRDNRDNTESFTDHSKEFGPTAMAWSKMLGLEQMTPELFARFTLAHELGHAVLYEKYARRPGAYRKLQNREFSKLPIPHKSARFLTTKDGQEFLRVNWDSIVARLKTDNKQQILTMQAEAYRNMKQERYADNFAKRVIDLDNRKQGFFKRVAGRLI